MKYILFIFFALLIYKPAFSQELNEHEKRLALTFGSFIRSPAFLDKKLTTSYVGNTLKTGGNLGALYMLTPEVQIGYTASLRYNILYYKNSNIFDPVKEFIADHHLKASYRISNQHANIDTYLGVGYSFINKNKFYIINLKNGNFIKRDLQYSTVDLIASFSHKKFHFEPMLMYKFSKDIPYNLGEHEPRMMINLKTYFNIGVL